MTAQPIARSLDTDLRPAGFRRSGLRWNRPGEGLVDVIDLQVAKSGGRLTVNLGVYDRLVEYVVWGERPRPFISPPDCTVQTRLGFLIDGGDRWWPIDVDSVNQISQALLGHGLPWLLRTQSRPAMIDFLISRGVARDLYPLPALQLAVLYHFVGEANESTRIIEHIRSRAGGESVDHLERAIDRLNQVEIGDRAPDIS